LVSYFIKYFVNEDINQILSIVSVLIFALIFYNIFSILNVFDSVKKQSKKIGKIWTLVAFINIIMNILLIPNFGLIGAVYSSMIAYIVGIVGRRGIK